MGSLFLDTEFSLAQNFTKTFWYSCYMNTSMMQESMNHLNLGDIYAADSHGEVARHAELTDTLMHIPKERIEQLSDEDRATYLSLIGKDHLIELAEPIETPEEVVDNNQVKDTTLTGRVDVDATLSVNELMAKYDIPKATAWRAKSRGYFIYGYHEKGQPSAPDIDWFTASKDIIDTSVEIGVTSAVSQYPIGDREVNIEDLKAEAVLRIFELSGVLEKRDNKGWLVNVAKNAARNFIKKHHPVIELSELT